MATHSSVLAWEIPETEEPGGLQFMGQPRVGHDLATKQQQSMMFEVGIMATLGEQCLVAQKGIWRPGDSLCLSLDVGY